MSPLCYFVGNIPKKCLKDFDDIYGIVQSTKNNCVQDYNLDQAKSISLGN